MEIREALTFDDVLLEPSESAILPAQAETRTRFTRSIELGIPIVSAAMDTVTESGLAIALAQAGGMGVIHKNLDAEHQADEVRKVKKFESGMVINPVTIGPAQTLAEALELMSGYGISGIPVVEPGDGPLVGILTNRDVRFAENLKQPVAELMTHEGLVTVREGVDLEEAKRLLHQHRIEKLLVVDEDYRCIGLVTVKEGVARDDAKRLLHQHRIEKLLVVDDDYRCIGLITVKDIEKAVTYPDATKDAAGRLRVAAATTVGDKGFART